TPQPDVSCEWRKEKKKNRAELQPREGARHKVPPPPPEPRPRRRGCTPPGPEARKLQPARLRKPRGRSPPWTRHIFGKKPPEWHSGRRTSNKILRFRAYPGLYDTGNWAAN